MAIGRRELGAILLGAAAIVFYLVLLSTTPSGAQTNGGTANQGGTGCSNPEEVATFEGAENQITDGFEITGNTFRLVYDITDLDSDPGFDSFSIRPIAENGIGVGDSVLVFDEGTGSKNILDGPGTFTLEIETEGFDYTVTVEDCVPNNQNGGGTTGSPTTNQGQYTTQDQTISKNQTTSRPPRNRGGKTVINVPNKPLPPSGGLPVYGIVAGCVLAGFGLLTLGLGIRRRTQG